MPAGHNRILRWISGWPLGRLQLLGAALGWATWALSPSYRRRMATNAQLAGVAQAQQRAAVAEAGKMVSETLWLWLMAPQRRVSDCVRWEGAQVVDAAVAAGRPLLMLTPHMGSFEVAARAYAERYGAAKPLTVLYRPARKAALRHLQESARSRPNMATAPASLAGVRQMLRALRRGEAVGLLPDQVPPDGLGVWAPFFGQPAYTMTLAARLAAQTGAALAMVRCERLPAGAGYVVHVSDLALPAAGGDDEAAQLVAATELNRAIERAVLQQPAQYLWGYNRYKRPRTASFGS